MLDGFYKLNKLRTLDDGFVYSVVFNVDHDIYKAHFPGNPITPGVCFIEICRHIMSLELSQEVRMVRAKNIKFINILKPDDCSEVNFEFHLQSSTKAQVRIANNDTEFVKISAEYQIPD